MSTYSSSSSSLSGSGLRLRGTSERRAVRIRPKSSSYSTMGSSCTMKLNMRGLNELIGNIRRAAEVWVPSVTHPHQHYWHHSTLMMPRASQTVQPKSCSLAKDWYNSANSHRPIVHHIVHRLTHPSFLSSIFHRFWPFVQAPREQSRVWVYWSLPIRYHDWLEMSHLYSGAPIQLVSISKCLVSNEHIEDDIVYFVWSFYPSNDGGTFSGSFGFGKVCLLFGKLSLEVKEWTCTNSFSFWLARVRHLQYRIDLNQKVPRAKVEA